jgi:hypothetical protein
MGRTGGQNAPERQGAKRPDRRGATCRSSARDTSEVGFPVGFGLSGRVGNCYLRKTEQDPALKQNY